MNQELKQILDMNERILDVIVTGPVIVGDVPITKDIGPGEIRQVSQSKYTPNEIEFIDWLLYELRADAMVLNFGTIYDRAKELELIS